MTLENNNTTPAILTEGGVIVNPTLLERTQDLHNRRGRLIQMEEDWSAKLNHFLVEHAEEVSAIEGAKAELGQVDGDLRVAIVTTYEVDPSKKQLGNGLGIRVSEKYRYDHTKALVWCIDHKAALQVDVSKLNAAIKAGLADGLEYETDTTVTATIAPDLGKALEGAE